MSRKLISLFTKQEPAYSQVQRVVWNSSIINEYNDLCQTLRQQQDAIQGDPDTGFVTDYTIEVMNVGSRKLENLNACSFSAKQENEIFIQTAIGLFAGLTLVMTDNGDIQEASYFAYSEGASVFKLQPHQAWSESLTLPATVLEISRATATENREEIWYLKMEVTTPQFYEKTPDNTARDYEVKKITMRLLLRCTIQ